MRQTPAEGTRRRWRAIAAWCLLQAGSLVVALGCGDGQQTDPRNLTYCGGTCWGTMCCAPSDDGCPRLMPLHGSPCARTGIWCGYDCHSGYYHTAQCQASGSWWVGEGHCDRVDRPDGGAAEDGGDGVPDAAGDAAADAAPPDAS
jgi:hypothetical protein